MPVIPAREHVFADLLGRRSADPLPRALGESAGVSVRVVEIPPGPRTPHRHPHSCEAMYVAAGTGRTWEGDRPSEVAAGDVVLVERGVPHATVNTGVEPLRLVCFFPRPALQENLEELDGPVHT